MVDEILDLVDENDAVIGQATRSEIYEKNMCNFRVINAFLINDNGELWIPKRAANKRVFPLCLDMSVGGHVETGETYEEALVRETMEELNIDLNRVAYKEVAFFTPYKTDVSAFMKVYTINYNQVPDYNRDDFVEYQWLLPDKLLELINSGVKAKGDLPKITNMLFWEDNSILKK